MRKLKESLTGDETRGLSDHLRVVEVVLKMLKGEGVLEDVAEGLSVLVVPSETEELLTCR